MTDSRLDMWHRVVFEEKSLLSELLHEDVEFHSPTVWTPKRGREVTGFILESVLDIFKNFAYHREWADGNNFALEFSATVENKTVKGIDLIRWNDEDQIVHFEVMLRPAKGVHLIGEKMAARLREAQ